MFLLVTDIHHGGAGYSVRHHDDDGHGPQQSWAPPFNRPLASLLKICQSSQVVLSALR